MSRSIPILLAAALRAGGCDRSEGRAPRPNLAGVYALQRTEVGPVPAVLGTRAGCTYTAAAGHVVLLPGNQYEAALIRVRECESPEAGVDTFFTDEGTGSFAADGDSLRFQLATGGTSGIGTFRGDTLVVRGTGQTMYYLRDEKLSAELLAADTTTPR